MSATDSDGLFDDLDVFTLDDYERARAVLVERFWMEHGLDESAISAACDGDLHQTDLADQWESLKALEPYVKAELNDMRAILDTDITR